MSDIEENIKIVKELLKGAKDYGQYNGNKYFYSIENILQDYTRQKEMNEEHQKINGELREKVKKLEETIEDYQRIYCRAVNDSILKQKIKDKFEKIQLLYENNLKEVDLKEVQKVDRNIFEGIRLEAQRYLTRELLQESEDK